MDNTPVQASFPLKAFEPPQPPHEVTPAEILGDAIQSVPAALLSAMSGPDAVRFAGRMTDATYQAVFTEGMWTGFKEGVAAHVRRWIDDLSRIDAALQEIGELTTVGISEQFVRPLFDDHPSGLLPQSQDVFAGEKWVTTVKTAVVMLDNVVKAGEFWTMLALTGTDLVLMIRAAGESWIRQFFFQTDLPADQGFMLGELFGGLTIEVIRMVIEPDAVMMLETVGTVVQPEQARP